MEVLIGMIVIGLIIFIGINAFRKENVEVFGMPNGGGRTDEDGDGEGDGRDEREDREEV